MSSARRNFTQQLLTKHLLLCRYTADSVLSGDTMSVRVSEHLFPLFFLG